MILIFNLMSCMLITVLSRVAVADVFARWPCQIAVLQWRDYAYCKVKVRNDEVDTVHVVVACFPLTIFQLLCATQLVLSIELGQYNMVSRSKSFRSFRAPALLFSGVLLLLFVQLREKRFLGKREKRFLGKVALTVAETEEHKLPESTEDNSTTSAFSGHDEYLQCMMGNDSLVRSRDHQSKFLSRKKDVEDFFPRFSRFRVKTASAGAILLTDIFGYLHIWKSGGTTIGKQSRKGQVSVNNGEFQKRDWFTFVRDPIDHFLSAWAECGERRYKWNRKKGATLPEWNETKYDGRIQGYAQRVVTVFDATASSSRTRMTCDWHALPQTNFMFDNNGKVHKKLKLVGDISEIPAVLELLGFHYDENRGAHRVASDSRIKTQAFPSRRDLLSNTTLLTLCEFLAMDYFLFDFEPPAVCQEPGGPLDFGSRYKFYSGET